MILPRLVRGFLFLAYAKDRHWTFRALCRPQSLPQHFLVSYQEEIDLAQLGALTAIVSRSDIGALYIQAELKAFRPCLILCHIEIDFIIQFCLHITQNEEVAFSCVITRQIRNTPNNVWQCLGPIIPIKAEDSGFPVVSVMKLIFIVGKALALVVVRPFREAVKAKLNHKTVRPLRLIALAACLKVWLNVFRWFRS